jgi:indolepyruvate ferredoxin oxidoreductase alpha subunit
VHLETCTNEAAAAAMLGASLNYPLRGAVTWKSIVGSNVASDALSNLASPGVTGGALIIIGEDYGEGASVVQERSHAFAMKSSIWLLDPRPDLPTVVRLVEKSFELSEASHAPVMMELRIRACYVSGEFVAKDNVPAPHSALAPIVGPARFEYSRLAHPPATFAQEKIKVEERLPAAQHFIRSERLNGLRRRARRDRPHRPGRALQFAAARDGAAWPGRRLWRDAGADLRALRRLSAGTPRRQGISAPASARC